MTWPPPPDQPSAPEPWQPSEPPPSDPVFQPAFQSAAEQYPSPWPDPRPAPRRRSGRTVAIAVVAAIVVIAAVVVGIKLAGGSAGSSSNGTAQRPRSDSAGASSTSSSSSRAAGGAPPAGGSGACSASNFLQHEVLAAQLTSVLQKRDEAGFLALATTASTRATMQLWWTNLTAIGFTTGGAQADLDDAAPRNTQVYMNIGVHSPLDPTTAASGATKAAPNLSGSWYLLTTTRGTGCRQRISAWHGLSNVPWDLPAQLTVVKTAHTVVAGPASVAATVRRVAPLAERAARWDFQFFRANNGARYLHQSGFITFIPGTTAQAAGWFRATTRQPKGWTGDPAAFAGLTRPLPGVQLPDPTGLPADTPTFAANATLRGGSRVLISKTGTSEATIDLRATLVHEFVHDLLDPFDTGYYLSGKGVTAATAEGAARWVEAYFHNSPRCYCANKKGKFPTALAYLTAGVSAKFKARFRGQLPSDAQVYGVAADANYYYDLSATTFDYLASKGTSFGLQSAVDAYRNGGGPFAGVFNRGKNGKGYFREPAKVQKVWARWVRAQLK